MKLYVLPPTVREDSISDLIDSDDIVFLADRFWQSGIASKYKNTIFTDDIITENTSKETHSRYKFFSREWFRSDGAREILDFEGVNIGAYFYMDFAVYLPKTLRAVDIAMELLERYEGYEVVLVQDESIWARTFELVVKNLGRNISLIRSKRKTRIKHMSREKIRTVLTALSAALYRLRPKRLLCGGTVLSCAGRFAEQLWSLLDTDRVYFLRPTFSAKWQVKTFRQIKLIQMTADFFYSKRHHRIVEQWLKERDIKSELQEHFKSKCFFKYKRIDLWDVIRQDLFKMLDSRLWEALLLVCRLSDMFKLLKLDCVIVDEDACSFNKVMEECALIAGVPVVQIIHGLLTFDNFVGEMKSDAYVTQGNYSRIFLMKSGVEEEKIFAIGAPHYAKRIESFDRNAAKENFCSKFNIPRDQKIVTLITQPFYCEEEPYFDPDNPLTADIYKVMIDISVEALRKSEHGILVIKTHHMDRNIETLKDIIKSEGMMDRILLIQGYDTIDIVASSDLVLCGGSTVYLESLLLRTPVLIFDSNNEKYWTKLKSDYLYFEDRAGCVGKIRGILTHSGTREERLKKQEEELLWHFNDKNDDSVRDFQKLIRSIGKLGKDDNNVCSKGDASHIARIIR